MELVSTIEISGEEREIADAYARGQIATNAQNIDGLNSNLSDLKMLGWSVPKECPIQNYVDSDGVFHQRVGRVDLGSLKFTVQAEHNRIITAVYVDSIKSVIVTNLPNAYTDYCRTETSSHAWNNRETIDRCLAITSTSPPDVIIYSPPSDLSELKGHYLYYELATPITMMIDGNEAVTNVNESLSNVNESLSNVNESLSNVNESLSVIGKCKNLLKPTLQTTTQNGVTCTDNGDGTYTLNGTATAKTDFTLMILDNLEVGKKYKLVGCPSGGSASSYKMFLQKTNTWDNGVEDSGNGGIFSALYNKTFECWIRIYKDATVSNFTFKPMLTTNTGATYNDFVPYTGDGDTLTADVAELKNDLSKQCKKDDITTNETLIGTFNGKNYYRKLFTGISGSGSSITVNVGEKIEIYNYYGRAYTYGQSGASDVKYPIPNKNYYIDSQNASETSFQLTIPTSSDTRKVDLVIEYTKVDEQK